MISGPIPRGSPAVTASLMANGLESNGYVGTLPKIVEQLPSGSLGNQLLADAVADFALYVLPSFIDRDKLYDRELRCPSWSCELERIGDISSLLTLEGRGVGSRQRVANEGLE